MKLYRYIFISVAAVLSCVAAVAQEDRAEVRRGNREFRKEQYREADVSYRKALLKDSLSVAANYNLASTLFRQQNFDEAAQYLGKISEIAASHEAGRDIFFNSGDVAIEKKDWQGAVDAFKKAMIKDPEDMEAKENYCYAKKMLENQQNRQNGGGGDNNQNQDQNQDNNQDNNNNQDNGQNQDSGQDRQPQDSPKISEQQAQQMLKAIQAKEQQTQDKVNREKAEAEKSRSKEKNW